MEFINKFPSKLELMPDVIEDLVQKLKGDSVSGDNIFDIRLCLEEVLINAIKHGNKFNPELFVEVAATVEHDKLIMTVKDEGQGFDFENVADPTQKENLEKTSGRGVFLVKKLMDEVEFLDNGSKIRMVKILSSQE